MNVLLLLVAFVLIVLGGILLILIKGFMKLSELSASLDAASGTLDAILLRLPVGNSDPEIGPVNEAAVTRINAAVEALNVAVPTTLPPV